jgi:hypothetical protein
VLAEKAGEQVTHGRIVIDDENPDWKARDAACRSTR